MITKHRLEGGKVSVKIEKVIESAALDECIDVWFHHHWKRGGGLPIFVSINEENNDVRTIYPIGMKEIIQRDQENESGSDSASMKRIIKYTVSEAGPFFAPHLIEKSHTGIVTFQPLEGKHNDKNAKRDIKMTWEVQFDTSDFRQVYQKVTEFTIGVASQTIKECLEPSRLLSVVCNIPIPMKAEKENLSSVIKTMKHEWYNFVWKENGGLPVPPPILNYGEKVIDYSSNFDENKNKDKSVTIRANILRVPPFLVESIVLPPTKEKEDNTIYYKIGNPGSILTFPFLVHTHLGRISFEKNEGNSDLLMKWQVEMRPYSMLAEIVRLLTEMTITTICRNFIVHLTLLSSSEEESNKQKVSFSILSKFPLEVPLSSWIGGVVMTESMDKDQSSSSRDTLKKKFQPWTWGRTGNGKIEDGDSISYEWTYGEVQK